MSKINLFPFNSLGSIQSAMCDPAQGRLDRAEAVERKKIDLAHVRRGWRVEKVLPYLLRRSKCMKIMKLIKHTWMPMLVAGLVRSVGMNLPACGDGNFSGPTIRMNPPSHGGGPVRRSGRSISRRSRLRIGSRATPSFGYCNEMPGGGREFIVVDAEQGVPCPCL